jgi:hypothetical protein
MPVLYFLKTLVVKIYMKFLRILIILFSFLNFAKLKAEEPKWLWVYSTTNFQVDKSVDDLITLMERSKKAGYNGILINDYKFGKIDDRPKNYYSNLTRVKLASEKIGIEIIPGVMPIGYSNSILINNPNLAEGIAVKNCLMKVKSGEASVLDSHNFLLEGNLETADKNVPIGWDWVDGFGISTVLDKEFKHAGESSLKMTNFKKGNEAGNCRLVKSVSLNPWHQYEITFWAKTKDLSADEIKVVLLTDDGKSLCFTNSGVKHVQDWTKHQILFNTLEKTKVKVYIGIWGGRSGTLWLDDISMQLVAGVNMLRRNGCPILVTSEDEKTIYQENIDFENWSYDQMGANPYPGSYQISHPQPVIKLKTNSKIKDDQILKVSFYHTELIYDDQICACLSEDEIFTHLKKQIELIDKYFKPKTYFMNHDEIRLAGQCELCRKSGKTAGQLLASNVRRCEKVIKSINPEAIIFVWSDMFDPFHNAVDKYYLVGSTLANSWEGLNPATVIANWNNVKSKESISFFAKRGHKQMVAGYYDSDKIKENIDKWKSAAEGIKSVDGYMYTTWTSNYKFLEVFAENVLKSK